jgi:hypothetical protein
MPRHPIDGVRGAKPRVPDAEKAENRPSKAEISRLNREYLVSRNRTQLAKAQAAEVVNAEKPGTFISRKLVGMQSAYLLTIFRQRTLLAPAAIVRRLASLALVDPAKEHAVSAAVREDIHILLTELSNLPGQVTDPNSMAKIDGDLLEQGRRRRASRAANDAGGSQGPGRERRKFAARKRLRRCAGSEREDAPS